MQFIEACRDAGFITRDNKHWRRTHNRIWGNCSIEDLTISALRMNSERFMTISEILKFIQEKVPILRKENEFMMEEKLKNSICTSISLIKISNQMNFQKRKRKFVRGDRRKQKTEYRL